MNRHEPRNHLRAVAAVYDRRIHVAPAFRLALPPADLKVGATLVFFLLLLPLPARAQDYLLETGSPTFTIAEPVEMGFINAGNGNLHIEIPVTSAPQRGRATYSSKFVYDSRIWKKKNWVWSPTNVSGWGGWRFITTADRGAASYTAQVVYCGPPPPPTPPSYIDYKYFTWTEPNGTKHSFNIATRKPQGCGSNVTSGSAYANDSTGYRMFVTSYTNAKVYAKDGTIVYDGTQATYTQKDTNGNYFTGSGGGNIVDTLNRPQDAWETAGAGACTGTGVSYCLKMLNSQNSDLRVKVSTGLKDVCTHFGASGTTEYGTSASCPYSPGANGTKISVITKIELPNGDAYTFDYDSSASSESYGLLRSMTLPTGATINYTHATRTDAAGNKNRWVSQRVTPDGTSTYSFQAPVTCPNPYYTQCQQGTVSRGGQNETVYTFGLNNGAWKLKAEHFTGTGASRFLAATVVTEYTSGTSQIRVLRRTVTPDQSGSVKVEYDSAATSGNITQIREYNYSATSPARTTTFTYQTGTSYTDRNILDRFTNVTVTDSGGTKVAETKITYDDYSNNPLTSVTGVTHHDDTNFGTDNTVRGNPTKLERWVSGTTYLSTDMTDDTTGQVRQVTDAKGNNTTFTYTNNFFQDDGNNPPAVYSPTPPLTNAYVYQVTLPASGTLTYGYYYNTGKMTLSTDQNNQTTYLHYLDSLDRLTRTILPDGGESQPAYPSVTQRNFTTKLSDSSSRLDQIILDTLGRVITTKSAIVRDVPDAIVDTTYDALGRVSTVSNPYRGSQNGVETLSYDGLNRVTTVTHPDSNHADRFYGSKVNISGGRATQLCSYATYGTLYPTLYKDEAGKLRQVWTDGLGRTIEVDEPDPATGSLTSGNVYNTCYSYNLLDNLIQVVQGSQTRTYTYDGLSRLTAVTTPESGTTNFYYTTDGTNLCSGDPNAVCRRTDARSITTTYTYDALNRLTQKSYDDNPQTPAAYYYYDEPSYTLNGTPYTLNNTRGRLSRTSAAGGNAITLHSYDAVGRIKDYWQCTPYNCSGATLWKVEHNYNLAGDLTSWKSPADVTVTHAISTAQRVTQISSSLTGATYPATLATLTYEPWGAVKTLLNGCAGGGCTQMQETYDYNNRLQPVTIRLGTSASPAANFCMVYNHYQGVANPTTCATTPTQASSGNNGNLVGYFLQDSTTSPTPDMGHTSSYTYDALSRLTGSTGAGNQTHNLTFGYDRYGNATCQPGGSGLCTQLSFDANNRITGTGYTYDAAGSMTGDGSCTYAWDGEGRLKSVSGCTSPTLEFVYNGLGQRVEKKQDTTYTEIAYDGFGSVIGFHDRSSWTQQFFPLGQTPFAKYQDNLTRFIHYDRLGSAIFLTDHSGATTQKLLYYPWGQTWVTGGTAKEVRFASMEQRDAETSLDPTLFRMYHSRLYRWLSPDPIAGSILNPQSLNRYAYVLNNPCSFVDPLGLQGCGQLPTGFPGRVGNITRDELRPGIGGEPFFDSPRTARDGTSYRHRALDLKAWPGQPLLPLLEGTVAATGFDYKGPGFYVTVSSPSGYRYTYMHLRAPAYVNPGESVKADTILAQAGSTGNAASLPLSEMHLHLVLKLKLKKERISQDPLEFMNSPCPEGVTTPQSKISGPGGAGSLDLNEEWLRFYALALLDIVAHTRGSGWYGTNGDVGCFPNCPAPPYPGWIPPFTPR